MPQMVTREGRSATYVPQGRYPAGPCRHFQTSDGKMFPPYVRHLVAVETLLISRLLLRHRCAVYNWPDSSREYDRAAPDRSRSASRADDNLHVAAEVG